MIRSRFCGQTLGLESKVKLFGGHNLGLFDLLVINGIRQDFAVVQDRNLILVINTNGDLGVAPGIGRSLSLDLVDDFLELEGQVFGEGACFLPSQNVSQIIFGSEGTMGIHGASGLFAEAVVEVLEEFRQIGIALCHAGNATQPHLFG